MLCFCSIFCQVLLLYSYFSLFRSIIFAHLVIILGHPNFSFVQLRLRISRMFHIQHVHFNATHYDGLAYLHIFSRQVNLMRARELNCSLTQPDLMIESFYQGLICQKFQPLHRVIL